MQNKFSESIPRKAVKRPYQDVAAFLLLTGVVFFFLYQGSRDTGYHWQWYRIPRFILTVENGSLIPGPLLDGLWITLHITLISFILTLFFGIVTAIFRLSDSQIARILARGYLEGIRNTPLLVQLFFIYFVIAPIVGLGRFSSAVLALGLFEGAYASEMFRAGILSVPHGQWEAARGLGLNTLQAYRHIILPQGVRKMLPPLTGQVISLVKDSALVSTIAISDLTLQGESIIAETFLAFEIWFTVAVIYLSITLTLSLAAFRIEKRMSHLI
ncbi:MAG: amino acid ABC transporter permease, partial [Thermodesulfobacteriota bacterium]